MNSAMNLPHGNKTEQLKKRLVQASLRYLEGEFVYDVTPNFPLVKAAFPLLVPQRTVWPPGQSPVIASQNAAKEKDRRV